MMSVPAPSAAKRRGADVLKITSGGLGPVPPCELEIKPLTVFVGKQGTGKSLVSQVLYFFEELPFLSSFVAAESRARTTSTQIVRSTLDQLRSHERAFATFANPNVTVQHTRAAPYLLGKKSLLRKTLKFSAHAVNRVIKPDKNLRTAVEAMISPGDRAIRNAVFFPTERLVISQLRTAIADRVLSLPITYTLFADWLEIASHVATSNAGVEATWIRQRGEEALGGSALRYGDKWKWRYGAHTGAKFDLDMASSGQRANWSLFYLASALFALRTRRDVGQELTLFVEEPEVHLHPAAQVVVAEVLAFLVRQGFRVVLSTHSLTVVYALNNLLQAHRLGAKVAEGTPAPNLRLNPSDVAVYAFGNGSPQSLLDADTGFIDETALGSVSEQLAAGMNIIGAHLPMRG